LFFIRDFIFHESHPDIKLFLELNQPFHFWSDEKCLLVRHFFWMILRFTFRTQLSSENTLLRPQKLKDCEDLQSSTPWN
jgi:hypothetical protein